MAVARQTLPATREVGAEVGLALVAAMAAITIAAVAGWVRERGKRSTAEAELAIVKASQAAQREAEDILVGPGPTPEEVFGPD